jgi:CRP-like cAMP-binding protein
MDPGVEIEIARVNAPNMLGEIGMWRGRPAIATVACAEPARLRVLRLDTPAFNALKAQSGFWNAVAAEVQKRLRVSMKHLEQSLRHSAVRIQDPELDGLLQLIAYINGDTTVQLDRIPGVHEEITLAECVDLLRQMASAVYDRNRQDPELQVHLGNLLDVIG